MAEMTLREAMEESAIKSFRGASLLEIRSFLLMLERLSGYKLVGPEATEEMIEFAICGNGYSPAANETAWRNMVCAAPSLSQLLGDSDGR